MINNLLILKRFSYLIIFLIANIFVFISISQKNNEIEKILFKSADQIKKSLDYDFDYIKYQLFYISEQISKSNLDKKNTSKILKDFTSTVNEKIDIAINWNNFSVIDRDNKLIIDAQNGEINYPIDLSGRDYLKRTAYLPNEIIIGEPVYGALSNRFIIPAAIGIFDDNQKYIATLVFGFDIEKITKRLEKILDNPDVSFAFFYNKNFVFASSNFAKNNIKNIEDKILASDSNDISGGMIIKQNIFNSSSANVFFQEFRKNSIDFVVYYSPKVYQSELIDVILKEILLFFGLFFLWMILLRRIDKKIIAPISQLSDLANKILNNDKNIKVEKPLAEEFKGLYEALINLKKSTYRERDLIIELQNANKKIAKENLNKSEFLSAISHDIRGPLSSAIMIIQNFDEANLKENLRDAEFCINDALLFINDLLDVSRISNSIFSIDMSKKIDVCSIIERMIRINNNFARKKNIEISLNCDDDYEEINLDEKRIKQIISNLINNSIKYSQNNSKIEIHVLKEIDNGNKILKIIIKDNGVGIDQKRMEEILVGQDEGGKKYESTNIDSFGLGLNIVKKLVSLQNGYLEIDSQIGVGTRVTIIFKY